MSFKSASNIVSNGLKIRKAFEFSNQKVAQWFPGHMASGMKKMQGKLTSLDCIVEVHDARIPISGRNPVFGRTLLGIKPYIYVLNKMDLIDMKDSEKVVDYYKKQGVKEVLFTNCKDQTNETIKKFIPLLRNTIENSNRYNRSEESKYEIMIIGVPNVGKSSFINALRCVNTNRRKATLVGKQPGVTKTLLEKIKICENPPIYLYDTPGVLPPQIADVETGLKLALINTIKNHLVGEDIIADYLLYRLNLVSKFEYVNFLGLDEPTDDIQFLLCQSALKKEYFKKIRTHNGISKVPDVMRVAGMFISAFRDGKFGYLELDEIPS